ncbi:HAD family hydrolase [Mucilaginibacter arboris]|uniref:HAD-IA family hydrolase n=1 Tax=Mucilaginibacter arboris TaxID=2682090 RepID=A0A7K1SSD3_9SPHI|nr:HAD family hydrolase [Mucilaginibacter arboris]MVN20211.1 HAD-IA family hydrolase [Mucilaginibacter arboris]
MPKYQHYSFDLWLTLIRSNPLFKQERTKFFHQHFNFQHKTLEEIALIFRQVDLMVNAVNEKTGKNIDADEMYLMVISLINNSKFPFGEIDLNLLETEMENLLFKHLPLVYCNQTMSVLEQICKTGKSTASILSNTGFISGKTLRKVLKELNLAHYFDFQLYSDETGMSKPNPDFFKLMLNHIAIIRKTENVSLNKIIHIGDNEKADVKGACAVGIQSLLINSNDQCISSLIN